MKSHKQRQRNRTPGCHSQQHKAGTLTSDSRNRTARQTRLTTARGTTPQSKQTPRYPSARTRHLQSSSKHRQSSRNRTGREQSAGEQSWGHTNAGERSQSSIRVFPTLNCFAACKKAQNPFKGTKKDFEYPKHRHVTHHGQSAQDEDTRQPRGHIANPSQTKHHLGYRNSQENFIHKTSAELNSVF